MNHASGKCFLKLFKDGDVDAAKALLQRDPKRAHHSSYKEPPLMREFVSLKFGHCDKPSHRQIADLLNLAHVRSFRDAVLEDQVDDVYDRLRAAPDLVSADFTASRGIAQAIHHRWSVTIGELLINAGADIDGETIAPLRDSPLRLQVGPFGSVEGVRLLLERGVDPNRTVLLGNTKLIELLLDYSWDINRGGLLHDTKYGFWSNSRTWLRYGDDPNRKGSNGRTALHLVATRGTDRDVIHAVVKAGADIKLRDNEGITPLDLARQAKLPTAARVLIELGAEE